MNKFFFLLMFTVASFAFAQERSNSKKLFIALEESRFHPDEWDFSVAASGGAGFYNGTRRPAIGGNFGMNHFFTNYLGIGIDDSVVAIKTIDGGNSSWKAGNNFQADLLLRYPICSLNLAPYAMVGGGGRWGAVDQGNGNVGGGVEWRFMPKVGLFADARWLYGDQALNLTLLRLGFRVVL